MKPILAKHPGGARHVPLLCSKSVCSLFAEISHSLLVLRQTTTALSGFFWRKNSSMASFLRRGFQAMRKTIAHG
jgi:hypothetical protein